MAEVLHRILTLAVLGLVAGCRAPEANAVAIGRSGVDLEVRRGAQVLARYRDQGVANPALFDVRLSGGIRPLRNHPLLPSTGEPTDHPHHLGIWFAHGDVNGIDFWTGKGRIEPLAPAEVVADGAGIAARHVWRATDGTPVAEDRRSITFVPGDDALAIEIEVTLIAAHGELRLGDTKEGTMAMRLRPELCLEGPRASGMLTSSTNRRGNDVWGKRALWVCYQAPVEGRWLAAAMFDHPQNHGSPTHWHARGYGLCAANPFGLHDFTGAPAGSGALVVPSGGELRFRYRISFTLGTAPRPPEAMAAERLRWLSGPD